MYEVVIGYVVGTVVGLLLFRMFVRERIVTATLDMLIQEEYVKSWEDEEGTTQLVKWREAVDVESWRRLYEEIDIFYIRMFKFFFKQYQRIKFIVTYGIKKLSLLWAISS